MQSIGLLAIFGFMYGVVALFIASISQSSMLHKALNEEKTHEIFREIEFVVNDRILLDSATFEDHAAGFNIATMLSVQNVFPQTMGRTLQEITYDPWGSEVQVRFADSTYAVSGSAVAPISAIALLSPGPDRVFQTTVPPQSAALTFRDVQRIEAATGSDDIVHTFTTLSAMKRAWNQLDSVIEKAQGLAIYNYQQQMDEFQPTIDQYYVDNSSAIFDAGFSIDDSTLSIWQTGDPSQNLDPIPVTTAGYPRMPSSLNSIGMDEEVDALPRGFQVFVTPNVCDLPESCRLFTISAGETPHSGSQNSSKRWSISHNTVLDGATGKETKLAVIQNIQTGRGQIAAAAEAARIAAEQQAAAEAAAEEAARRAAEEAARAAAQAAAAQAAAAEEQRRAAEAAAQAAAQNTGYTFDLSGIDWSNFNFSGGGGFSK